jgi:hypothetical protein
MDKNEDKLTPRYLIYDIVRFQVTKAKQFCKFDTNPIF